MLTNLNVEKELIGIEYTPSKRLRILRLPDWVVAGDNSWPKPVHQPLVFDTRSPNTSGPLSHDAVGYWQRNSESVIRCSKGVMDDRAIEELDGHP